MGNLPILSIYVTSSLYLYDHMNIDLIVWVILSYCLSYFVAQIFPVVATGNPLVALFLFVTQSVQSVVKHFLIFWDSRMHQACLVYCLSSFRISRFFKDAWLGNPDQGS